MTNYYNIIEKNKPVVKVLAAADLVYIEEAFRKISHNDNLSYYANSSRGRGGIPWYTMPILQKQLSFQLLFNDNLYNSLLVSPELLMTASQVFCVLLLFNDDKVGLDVGATCVAFNTPTSTPTQQLFV